MESLNESEQPSPLPRGVLRVRSNGKRLYADEFKAELVRQCLVPGTSVAATGPAHGINANLLRRWIVQHGAGGGILAGGGACSVTGKSVGDGAAARSPAPC